jgi:hypothetical protein
MTRTISSLLPDDWTQLDKGYLEFTIETLAEDKKHWVSERVALERECTLLPEGSPSRRAKEKEIDNLKELIFVHTMAISAIRAHLQSTEG